MVSLNKKECVAMKNEKSVKTTQKKSKFRDYLRYLRIKFKRYNLKSGKNKNASLDVRHLSDHLKKDIGIYDKDH